MTGEDRFYRLECRTVPISVEEADNVFKCNRGIAFTRVNDVRISTVFLCLDHNLMGTEKKLFETMVFGGNYNGEMYRYSNYQDAMKGHHDIEKKVFGDDV